MAGSRSLNPTCEDYHSEESDHDSVLEENFPRSSPAPPPGQANVAAKRSQNSVGSERPPTAEKVAGNVDVQSDSGYSSHTAATMSSADSAPSAKSQSPPAAPVNPELNPPPSPALKKRPALGEERKRSSQQSPRKPLLSRNGSVSSRNPSNQRDRRSTVTEECRDPNCNKCAPSVSSRGRRPPPSSIDSTLDTPYVPSDQRSQRSDPAPNRSSYISPQSPTYSRQPGSYMHGPAVLQPATTRRRSSSRARPVSYHGGDAPQGYQWSQGAAYPSPPQDHGPPPALSAYQNMHQSQMSPYPYGATPPNNYYHPGAAMPTPPYDSQRPPMPTRNSSTYSARRPTSTYGTTLITQGQSTENMPSARYPSAPQSARTAHFPPQAQIGYGRGEDDDEDDYEESSEYASESEEEDHRDRRLMPPPKLKGSTERRPSLRRPHTDYPVDRRMSQSLTLDASRGGSRDPRASQISTAATSRSTSKARPKLVQQPKAQSAFETTSRRDARITVEDSRSRRRSEQQIYDRYDHEARRRSKMYQDEVSIAPTQRRRKTDADTQRRGESNGQSKLRDNVDTVEAYMNRTRGSDTPLNDQVHRIAKQRANRVSSGPSDAGSARSKGSDHKSRVSHSARTTVTNATNAGGEIRLKVDASAPLSLQFNGDMEGRLVNINPAEGGMAEIVIGSARGSETTYASERSSVAGNRRSTIGDRDRGDRDRARRGAEESSVRSERSSRGRRESYLQEDRLPLRRREQSRYNS